MRDFSSVQSMNVVKVAKNERYLKSLTEQVYLLVKQVALEKYIAITFGLLLEESAGLDSFPRPRPLD